MGIVYSTGRIPFKYTYMLNHLRTRRCVCNNNECHQTCDVQLKQLQFSHLRYESTKTQETFVAQQKNTFEKS